MDVVYIKQLRVDTIIGIYPWERSVRQTLVIDLDMATDASVVAASGRLEDALDYSAIAARVTDFIQLGEYQLLETLAEALAAMLREEFAIVGLRLRVGKPGAVGAAADVGVIIERGLALG